MKNFKEYMEILTEKNESHKNGTYVSVQLSKDSTKELYDWAKKNNITNPIDPYKKDNEYHVTVVYSRKGIPDAEGEDIGLPLNLKITGWKIFPTQTGAKCLVGTVDSKELQKAHDTYRKDYGATYDFPEYIPHITLSYDYGNGKVPSKLPDITLTFDKKQFKGLDPNYIPSNDKD